MTRRASASGHSSSTPAAQCCTMLCWTERAQPTQHPNQPQRANQQPKKTCWLGMLGGRRRSRYVAVLRLEGLRVPFEPSDFANRFVLTNLMIWHVVEITRVYYGFVL
jgi:hypothetical protein